MPPLGFVVGLRAEAALARRLGRVAIGGGGAAGALVAANQLAASGVSGLISFGLAGGLAPWLQSGMLIRPASVLCDGQMCHADPALLTRFGGATEGLHLAGSDIVALADQKAALHNASGAWSVDLETKAVIAAANAHALPWMVLRAICDPASRTLPTAALVALDQTGKIGPLRVVAAFLGNLGQIPALLALGRDAARAPATLRQVRLRD